MRRYRRPGQVTIGSAIRKCAAAPAAGRAAARLIRTDYPVCIIEAPSDRADRSSQRPIGVYMTRQDESGNDLADHAALTTSGLHNPMNGSGATLAHHPAIQPFPWAVLTAEEFSTCQLEWAAAEPPPARRGRPSPPAGEQRHCRPGSGAVEYRRARRLPRRAADGALRIGGHDLRRSTVQPPAQEGADPAEPDAGRVGGCGVGSVQHLSRLRPVHLSVASRRAIAY